MKKRYLFITLFSIILFTSKVLSQNATEIVKKADEKARGEKSNYCEMTMKIIRSTWERTISFKTWTKDKEYAMVLITAPAKEKGQSFLKRKNELWNWNPVIHRVIKMPSSMLAQGWMGSDVTNDDILNESSIVNDYTHKLIGEEKILERICYKIELIPKPDAPVVWGKIILWISKDDYLQLKAEYYNEFLELIKTEVASDIKEMDKRLIPTKFEILPSDKNGNKTILTIDNIKFNIPIKEDFFSIQNMKNIK